MLIQRICAEQEKSIVEIYDILRLCGEDMYDNQGLEHWKTPYPVERIKEDCQNKYVYLATDEQGNAVATLQLSVKGDMLELCKFGVRPNLSGKGIGGQCIKFIEEECKKLGFRGIYLDVYDKSKVAIGFYLKHGFVETGSHPTRRFNVLEMKKTILE